MTDALKENHRILEGLLRRLRTHLNIIQTSVSIPDGMANFNVTKVNYYQAWAILRTLVRHYQKTFGFQRQFPMLLGIIEPYLTSPDIPPQRVARNRNGYYLPLHAAFLPVGEMILFGGIPDTERNIGTGDEREWAIYERNLLDPESLGEYTVWFYQQDRQAPLVAFSKDNVPVFAECLAYIVKQMEKTCADFKLVMEK